MFHLLFNLKGWPMLRHEMAHGKLSASNCYSGPCIYAFWLMFHITCSLLVKLWELTVSWQFKKQLTKKRQAPSPSADSHSSKAILCYQ